MMSRRKISSGFTLIELLITLAIGVVLTMVAIPSLTTFKRNAELTSATNTFIAAINAARSEAMKRGMNSFVVPTNNGSDWSTGWVIFVDKDRTQTYSPTSDGTILVQNALPAYFSVTGTNVATGSTPYIMFDASGYAKTKTGTFGALTITLTRNDLAGNTQADQTRRIIISKTGRTRTCKPTSTSDASCSTSATD
ncbi:GspH/FimT family pseudopilin [Polaromonas sp.]|uniref:GspH/FimT family pseudopilin n=1 Tax=Polaromonas sp. TaxID=1869339 RepID=UPI0032661510